MWNFSDLDQERGKLAELVRRMRMRGGKPSLYTLSCRVDEDQYMAIAKISEALGIKYSDAMRIALKIFIDLHTKPLKELLNPETIYLIMIGEGERIRGIDALYLETSEEASES